MRVTRKSDYGLRALCTLARRQEPVSIGQLSAEHKIPEPFLEKIMQELREHGLVEATHGRGGGYLLKKCPSHISLREIVHALDGPIALVTCLDPNLQCSIEASCPTSSIWEIINQKIEEYLAALTLGDVLSMQQPERVSS